MRKWKILFSIFLFIAVTQNGFAQEIPVTTEDTAEKYSGFFIGGQASTNGLGFHLQYIIGERLTFKSGMESMHINYSFLLKESDISYNSEFSYKTGGLFFLADFFYARSLYITGGMMMNNLRPQLVGVAVTDLAYGDITIPASDVGDFRFSLQPDLKFSPFIGVGVRKFLGKNRSVSWNFETGLFYLGPPQIEIQSAGLLAPTSNPAFGRREYLEKQFSVYKYYPVVKYSIGIRLF